MAHHVLRSRQGQRWVGRLRASCPWSSAQFIHGLLGLQANPLSAGIQPVRSSVFDDFKWHRVR